MVADQLGHVLDRAAFCYVDELEVFLDGGLLPSSTWAGVNPVEPHRIAGFHDQPGQQRIADLRDKLPVER